MAFWAVEIVPGKDHVTTPEFDLHVTQAVLPAKASDKGRSIVQCSIVDDEKEEKSVGETFALASLKIDIQENATLDLIFEAGQEVHFSVAGKNPVQLVGYYISDEGDQFAGLDDEIDSDDEDALGVSSGDEEGDEEEEAGLGEDDDEDIGDDEDDSGDDEDIEEADQEAIDAALRNQIQKRKPETALAQNGAAKKAKTEVQGKGQQGQNKQQQGKPQQQQQQGGQKTPQQQQGQKTPQQQQGQKAAQQQGQKTPQQGQKSPQQQGQKTPQQQGQKTPQQQQGGQKPQTPATGQKPQQQQPKGSAKKQNQ